MLELPLIHVSEGATSGFYAILVRVTARRLFSPKPSPKLELYHSPLCLNYCQLFS